MNTVSHELKRIYMKALADVLNENICYIRNIFVMTVRIDSMRFLLFFLIVSVNCTWFSLSQIKSVCLF